MFKIQEIPGSNLGPDRQPDSVFILSWSLHADGGIVLCIGHACFHVPSTSLCTKPIMGCYKAWAPDTFFFICLNGADFDWFSVFRLLLW